MDNREKLLFLSNVKDKKNLLFGKFSNELTRENKQKAWKDIVDILKVHNVALAKEKDLSYFRDTVWPNLKRYTVEKRDKKAKTGAEGGSKVRWTDVDAFVLDIIGPDSPGIMGLPITETWDEGQDPDAENRPLSVINSIEIDQPTKRKAFDDSNGTTKRKRLLDDFTNEFKEKKLRKIDLEIENLELRNEALRRNLYQQNPMTSTIVDEGLSYTQL